MVTTDINIGVLRNFLGGRTRIFPTRRSSWTSRRSGGMLPRKILKNRVSAISCVLVWVFMDGASDKLKENIKNISKTKPAWTGKFFKDQLKIAFKHSHFEPLHDVESDFKFVQSFLIHLVYSRPSTYVSPMLVMLSLKQTLSSRVPQIQEIKCNFDLVWKSVNLYIFPIHDTLCENKKRVW